MKTFILQYRENGVWKNFTIGSDFAIEFLQWSAANFVAQKLSKLLEYPTRQEDWQIKDSTGQQYDVFLGE